MNIFIDIIYLIFLFWLAALAGVDAIYKLNSETTEKCKLVRNRNGRAIIKLDSKFILYNIFLLTILIVYGAIALLIQRSLYELLNWIFHINLKINIYEVDIEWWIAIAYSWLIACGFYAGRSFVSYFAAQQILNYINRSNPDYNPTFNLTIFKVLEENLRREESRLNERKR